jgi:hypothetical protein
MIDATIQLLLYALLAGFSALAFAGTLAVMQAGDGRVRNRVRHRPGVHLLALLILGVVVTGASKRTR